KIFESDPFARLDQNGVGKLVEMAAKLGRQTRPDIKLGICGEHGGDPSSVRFCHRAGLNYVSCSPFRVPIARLAAAHAAIPAKPGYTEISCEKIFRLRRNADQGHDFLQEGIMPFCAQRKKAGDREDAPPRTIGDPGAWVQGRSRGESRAFRAKEAAKTD